MTNNQLPELLSDKELRHKTHLKMLSKSGSSTEFGELTVVPLGFAVSIAVDLINQQTQAAEKRGELKGRIDCLKRLPTVRTHFTNGSASDVVLKSTIDRRLATLDNEAKEINNEPK